MPGSDKNQQSKTSGIQLNPEPYVPKKRGNTSGKGGRPPGKVSQAKLIIAQAAAEHAYDALMVLVQIAQDKRAPAASRVTAANAILDRAYGKPAQALKVGGDPENPAPQMIQIYLPDNGRDDGVAPPEDEGDDD